MQNTICGTILSRSGSYDDEVFVTSKDSTAIVLRFRDLVTEVGGTIAEHRRIVRLQGHVWWGWWFRQSEYVPRAMLAQLFVPGKASDISIILFHATTLELYITHANRVVVAPSAGGIQSPEFEYTPEYYLRARYPLWFQFERDIVPFRGTPLIVGRPTKGPEFDYLPELSVVGETVSLADLRDERPTLWLARIDSGTDSTGE